MGYILNKTPNGTSLSIPQPSGGGGGGGGGAAIACPFEVTDVSEPGQSGQLTLKLNVKCELVRAYNIWPTGTSEEHPNHVIVDLPVEAGWYGIYLWIELDQEGNLTKTNGVDFQPDVVWRDNWVESTSTDLFVYLGGVTLSADTESHIYVSNIENACPVIQRPTLPACPFLVEPSLKILETGLNIQIRSGKINGNYPTGMDSINTYLMVLGDSTNYRYIYCVMVVKDGVIQTGPNDVTFGDYEQMQESTSTLAYFLVAEVQTGYDAQSDLVVEYVYNYCTVPFTFPISYCPFRLTNVSSPTAMYLEVQFGYVNGDRIPDGMPTPPATTPPLILTVTADCFVYCAITYDSNFNVPYTGGIVFSTSSTVKTNTATIQYVLVGTVKVIDGRIDSISNVCSPINFDACSLKFDLIP